MVIAIDGPAGAGKSTVARGVARELGFTYMDTGAMYRCVALLSLRDPEAEPASLARSARIALRGGSAGAPPGSAGSQAVSLDGQEVSEEIRTAAVAEAASRVAAHPEVRAALVAKQRDLLASGDWVAEGRDIGTVVAPDAALKVFLTASPVERARRRAAELGADPGQVLAEQALRDARDRQRAAGPLLAAPGAVTLDTTDLSAADVIRRIVELGRAAVGGG